MDESRACEYCGDPIEDDPILRGEKIYCCEACAFEASRSADCGGRTDSNVASPVIER